MEETTTIIPLIVPKKGERQFDRESLTWINDQLMERQDKIQERTGSDTTIGECFDEILDAFLDTMVWAWILARKDDGEVDEKFLEILQLVGRQAFIMRAYQAKKQKGEPRP